MSDQAPNFIWLQDGDGDPDVEPLNDYEGVTWCGQPVADDDTKYIRFDEHERLLAEAMHKHACGIAFGSSFAAEQASQEDK